MKKMTNQKKKVGKVDLTEQIKTIKTCNQMKSSSVILDDYVKKIKIL